MDDALAGKRTDTQAGEGDELHRLIRQELDRRLQRGEEASIEDIVRWVMERGSPPSDPSSGPTVDPTRLRGVSELGMRRFQAALTEHPRPRFQEESLTLDDLLSRSSWWLLSLALHLVLGALLAMWMIMVPADEDLTFYSVNIYLEQPDPQAEPGVQEDEPADTESPEDEEPEEPEPEPEDVVAETPEPEPESPPPEPLADEDVAAPPTEDARALSERRTGENRDLAIGRFGGNSATESAVADGLTWLARHQSRDGSWSADRFGADCPDKSCWGAGDEEITEGVTGLALLCFLGAGITHQQEHRHAGVVQRGLDYLCRIQDRSSGLIGRAEGESGWIYEHAIGSLVLSEAYALSGDERLRAPVQRAIDYLVMAQQTGGAWDYTHLPTGRNDTSVTGWVVMALRSAHMAGTSVPPETTHRALTYLRRSTEADGEVIYANQEPATGRRGIGMVAVGLLGRMYLGESAKKPILQRMARRVSRDPPSYDQLHGNQFHTMYYWYYGTLALFHVGGQPWEEWNTALQATLLPAQVSHGHGKGSWDPEDPWLGEYGGRVYSTALNVLNLEIYYRYLPLYAEHGGLPPALDEDAPHPDGLSTEPEGLSVAAAAELCDSSDSQQRARAVRALVEQGSSDGAVEGLLGFLEDPLPTIRWQVVRGLRELGAAAAVPRLLERLPIEEEFMQRVIVEALGELGDPAAIPTLARLLDNRDQALRTRVMRALQRLTGESLGSNRERWRSWLREHGHLQD
jgi:hypothetical protein